MSRLYQGDSGNFAGAGAIQGVVHKFGENRAVGSGAEETIWAGAASDYHWISTAGTAVVASAATTADSGVIVTLEGLDAAGLFQSDTVTLDSNGTVTTSTVWLRTHRMYTAATSAAAATGIVTCTVDSGISAHYTVAAQQTQQLAYTIPANRVGYLVDVDLEVGKADEARATIRTRDTGSVVWRARDNFHLYEDTISRFHALVGDPTTGIKLPALCDVEMRAQAVTGSASVAGFFHVVLYAA